MTSVMRLTFLTLGILLLKEISSASLKKSKGTPPSKVPELHDFPALPGRPDLPSLPALPNRPDLPWLPPLPNNMSTSILSENLHLTTLPGLSAKPGFSTLSNPSLPTLPTLPTLTTLPTLPTLPTRPSRLTLPTITLGPITKFTTRKPSLIDTTFASSESSPKSSSNFYTITLTPNKTKPCCSGQTLKTTTNFSKKPKIPTSKETKASTVPNKFETTRNSTTPGISLTKETIASTFTNNWFSTVTVHSTKLEAPESSTTSISATEAQETSRTSFPVTEKLENSTSKIVTQQDEKTVSAVDPSTLCPDNQSLISERDLETIAKYKIDNMSLAELLNESFYAEAVSIKDNIKEELEHFLTWFQDRPAHMKHILEHLTKIRTKLEKNVNIQSDKLQEYVVLENEYNTKAERLQKLSKRVENYKNVCKLNCEEDLLSNPFALQSKPNDVDSSLWRWKIIDESLEQETTTTIDTSGSDIKESIIIDQPEEGGLKEIPLKYTEGGKYYCSNIDALIHRIEKILLHNLEISKNDFKHKIIEDSKILKEKLEEHKKTLKSIALAHFGSSMYDILNLQDQYYHFDELLKTNVHDYIIQTKKHFAAFESMIMDLEVRAERLKKYCSTCNLALRRLGNSATKDHVKETDLVDYVINKMYGYISEEVLVNYNKIINELEPIFKDWESSDDKVANLKPIQEEIERMTAQETKELNKLKEAFPKSSIASAVELQEKAKELNENANALGKELAEKYNL